MAHIPKPFKRPGIDLTPAGPKKQWRHALPAQISVGDVVQGDGLVTAIRDLDELDVVFEFKSGRALRWSRLSTLVAFTAGEGRPYDG